MAAVTVKEESEDPDYYQYNIQGNTISYRFSFQKSSAVKIQIYQMSEFLKYFFIDCVTGMCAYNLSLQ